MHTQAQFTIGEALKSNDQMTDATIAPALSAKLT